jgi:acetylornithine/N-succinyldiaminopimelate aminotransferase
LTSSQITDKPSFREGLPSTIFVDYIPFYNPARPKESIQEAMEILKKCLHRYPNKYALMCLELVQGEGGFYFGSSEFYRAIMALLREHHIAIIIDEVQTFGRLPSLFAFKYFNLEEFADIVTIGKASQVCATLYRKEFKPKPSLLSQTFTGSTSAIKASAVIIQQLLQGNFFGAGGRIEKIHELFSGHLQRLSNKYPHLIEGPFGIGSMIAFTPLGGEEKQVLTFIQTLFNEGLMTFAAGSNPTRVRMLIPAMVITDDDIGKAVDIIENTLLKFK